MINTRTSPGMNRSYLQVSILVLAISRASLVPAAPFNLLLRPKESPTTMLANAFDRVYRATAEDSVRNQKTHKIIELFDRLSAVGLLHSTKGVNDNNQVANKICAAESEYLRQASELVDLVRADKDDNRSGTGELYELLLQQVAGQLRRLCQAHWDEQLRRLVEGELSEQVREKWRWLFESLITLGSYRNEPREAPYTARQLAHISREPPAGALLVYMSRFQLPEMGQLDENMKSLVPVDWPTFRAAATRTLAPLCKPICAKLSQYSHFVSPYRQLVEEANERCKDARMRIIDGPSPFMSEWLAANSICCKLVSGSQHFDPIIERVYHELIDKSEEMIDRASEKELAFSEKVANNKH